VHELGDLYQEVILDNYKHPKNYGALEDATHKAHGDNPLCGDKIALHVRLKGDVVDDLRFKGLGCAISTAAASLMTEALKGRTRADVDRLFERYHAMVMGKGAADDLGKLEAFAGVSEFPARVKCATLCWHTLKAALDNQQDPVSTE
jgi:nitrogen fixation NifU-like protein